MIFTGNSKALDTLTLNLLPWLSIFVNQGEIPDILPGATHQGVLWQAAPGRFLLKVPKVAKYLVEDGSRVTIEPVLGASQDLLSRFFKMTPLAALMYQRGQLAFHAAAAAPPGAEGDKAILIAGDSAAGKSTLLVGLQQRGWRILADELSLIMENEDGRAAVLPIAQEVLLWEDAVEKLGLPEWQVSDLVQVHAGGRRVVTVTADVEHAMFPITNIIRLSVHSQPDIELKKLEGMRAFHSIGELVYNSHIADAILSKQDYLRQAGILTQRVPIFHLNRPRGQWSVEALADVVESVLIGKGADAYGDL